MMLQKSRAVLQNFADATQYEWLETNGLGGWSGSTVIGAHTRRYHGVLTAAIVPPAERMVLLSKLDETLVTDTGRHELGVNLYPSHTIHPNGHHYLKIFRKDIFPEWEYEADDVLIRKTVCMLHGENTVVIWYEVLEADNKFTMEFLPLTAARGYHSLQKAGPQMHWDVTFNDGIFHNSPDGQHDLFIQIPGSAYTHSPCWYNNFQYTEERNRGLDYEEDLFSHGVFTVQLKKGDMFGVIISTSDPSGRNAFELCKNEKQRRTALLTGQPSDQMVKQLVLAADQFIVQRNIIALEEKKGSTIIAGYPWFTDWGRDTMISLTGLTLSTGRYEDAKEILRAFAASVSEGMLPNRFRDDGQPPEYNNVDGTLWYFIAVYNYLTTTGDNEFVLDNILPVLQDIIDWHLKGTRYNIKADSEGLLCAGEKGQQLTWMDARIGEWVVTPRMGKPVEIQALWYNALKIYEALLKLADKKEMSRHIAELAAKMKDSFNDRFWNNELNCLYDVISADNIPDATLRPNQLLAISLPFALVSGTKATSILNIVTEKLYTPAGLRTLPAEDARYTPVYTGDQWQRDAAYHQGTVWSWLLGPYIDAIMKIYGDKGNEKARQIIAAISYHLEEACIGSISEIFDADMPHYPRGCTAQAWSVAELLRVITDYQLITITPAKKRKTKKKKV